MDRFLQEYGTDDDSSYKSGEVQTETIQDLKDLSYIDHEEPSKRLSLDLDSNPTKPLCGSNKSEAISRI